jgi:hypothetical protein
MAPTKEYALLCLENPLLGKANFFGQKSSMLIPLTWDLKSTPGPMQIPQYCHLKSRN